MTAPAPEPDLLEEADASLLDLVDHVLNKGVVVTGDVMLGLAGVDLVYLRLSALLCAADRILPPDPKKR
jgi:gas vesicle protein GvpA/GvpJ/GvpM family